MELIALVGLSLGFFTLALWQKKTWIMLGAAMTFLALGAYGLIGSKPGEALWIIGTFSMIFSFVIFLYAIFRMSEKSEPESPEEPDESYARELREESEARRNRRDTWRRRPRY